MCLPLKLYPINLKLRSLVWSITFFIFSISTLCCQNSETKNSFSLESWIVQSRLDVHRALICSWLSCIYCFLESLSNSISYFLNAVDKVCLNLQACVELLEEENIQIPSWICFTSVDGENAPSGESFKDCFDIINKSSKVHAVGINCAPPHVIESLICKFKEVSHHPPITWGHISGKSL